MVLVVVVVLVVVLVLVLVVVLVVPIILSAHFYVPRNPCVVIVIYNLNCI